MAPATSLDADIAAVIELGLNHEQQHQELILTDIKHALAQNPLRPAYRDGIRAPSSAGTRAMRVVVLSRRARLGRPRRPRVSRSTTKAPATAYYLEPFQLGSRLVTSGEFLAFIDDGGYARPELWLSDGWNVVNDAELEGAALLGKKRRRRTGS